MEPRGELAHRRRADHVRGVDDLTSPSGPSAVIRQPPCPSLASCSSAWPMSTCPPRASILVARGVPHHARPEPRIAEGLEQRLDRLPVVGPLVEPERALEPVGNRAPQAEALDALRGPVGAHLVARHAPHLLGVGLEEDRIEPLAELVDGPVLEALHFADREQLGPERSSACRRPSAARRGSSAPRTRAADSCRTCPRNRCGSSAGAG